MVSTKSVRIRNINSIVQKRTARRTFADKGKIMKNRVFISYAADDLERAETIRNDLETAGAATWMAENDLVPGQNRKSTITQAIRKSLFFLALLSSNYLNQKSFAQKELKTALDIRDEYPADDISVIPVRVDQCEPVEERLAGLHRVDLFPSYEAGLKKILAAVLNRQKTASQPVSPVTSEPEMPDSSSIQADTFDEVSLKAIHDYCKKARSLHEKIPLAGFKTNLRVPIHVEDIYVPLGAMIDKRIVAKPVLPTRMMRTSILRIAVAAGKFPFRTHSRKLLR